MENEVRNSVKPKQHTDADQYKKAITIMSGLILGLRPAYEKRRYKVTPSLIGWAQT